MAVVFVKGKVVYFNSNFTEIGPFESNWQSATTGSENGFVPIERQAITRVNYGLVYWRKYESLGLGELRYI